MSGVGLRSLTRPPQPFPVSFTVDGRRMSLPDHSSGWWVRTLAYQAPHCWWQIIPMGLRHQDRIWLLMRLDDPADPFDMDEVETLAEKVIEQALGMNVWVAHRLMAIAQSQWVQLQAWCIQQGVLGLLDGHPAQIASAVYAWRLAAAGNAGEERKVRQELNKLDAEVWAPPPMHMHSGNLRDMAPPGWSDAVVY